MIAALEDPALDRNTAGTQVLDVLERLVAKRVEVAHEGRGGIEEAVGIAMDGFDAGIDVFFGLSQDG